MTGRPAIDDLPALPRDAEGPVFREPWEAQAFALAVQLSAAGVFTWAEWTAALAGEIRAAQAAGDPDLGDTYYRHWLAALERLVVAKGLADAAALADRKGGLATGLPGDPARPAGRARLTADAQMLKSSRL